MQEMSLISLPAHFDGQFIQLDEPFKLEPNTKLIVTVLPKADSEQEAGLQRSMEQLGKAHSDEEDDSGASVQAAIKRAQQLVRQYVPEHHSLSEELIQERRQESERE
jgi:hypothetical protein